MKTIYTTHVLQVGAQVSSFQNGDLWYFLSNYSHWLGSYGYPANHGTLYDSIQWGHKSPNAWNHLCRKERCSFVTSGIIH